MMDNTELRSWPLQQQLTTLYGPLRRRPAAKRLSTLLARFRELYGRLDARDLVISAPGRTELAGNHTDHNHGRVIAAAVDLDVLGVIHPRGDRTVRIHSEGYRGEFVLELDDLLPREQERGRFEALVRGVAAGLADAGFAIDGFDCCMHSTVGAGSGLSSSAAVEVFTVAALCCAAGTRPPKPAQSALIAQRAENHFFGKPCGLMDQLACSHGGAIAIDFAPAAELAITPLRFTPREAGYELLVVESGADHDDLTEEYAAVPAEMRAVAALLGAGTLRSVPCTTFFEAIPQLRNRLHERPILRAMHYFEENRRVQRQVSALEAGDFAAFLELVRQSGSSSWRLLQNCTTASHGKRQQLALALALSEQIIPEGAWRVHGGGFAGTMQAYVPQHRLDDYVSEIGRVFGVRAATTLSIREYGPVVLGSALDVQQALESLPAFEEDRVQP
ncbi:MAG: galactokinase [Spirochaetaceae bacterium]|nr:MAG: galactokinase [Spirochaetaceae bacterium]